MTFINRIVIKRLIFRLVVALVAFGVGIGCKVAFDRYLEVSFPVICEFPPRGLERLYSPLPSERSVTQLPARTLPVELQRIDETYRRRCRLPTDWGGDWPTIKQLDRFRACNDEWAKARREAINTELNNYMVQY